VFPFTSRAQLAIAGFAFFNFALILVETSLFKEGFHKQILAEFWPMILVALIHLASTAGQLFRAILVSTT
jgi:hypothetical protein